MTKLVKLSHSGDGSVRLEASNENPTGEFQSASGGNSGQTLEFRLEKGGRILGQFKVAPVPPGNLPHGLDKVEMSEVTIQVAFGKGPIQVRQNGQVVNVKTLDEFRREVDVAATNGQLPAVAVVNTSDQFIIEEAAA